MSNSLGQVLNSKAGKFYIKLGQKRDAEGNLFGKEAVALFPITLANGTVLNEGDALFLKDPRVTLNELAEKQIIDSNVAIERIAKIPDFVKYDIEVNTKKA